MEKIAAFKASMRKNAFVRFWYFLDNFRHWSYKKTDSNKIYLVFNRWLHPVIVFIVGVIFLLASSVLFAFYNFFPEININVMSIILTLVVCAFILFFNFMMRIDFYIDLKEKQKVSIVRFGKKVIRNDCEDLAEFKHLLYISGYGSCELVLESDENFCYLDRCKPVKHHIVFPSKKLSGYDNWIDIGIVIAQAMQIPYYKQFGKLERELIETSVVDEGN